MSDEALPRRQIMGFSRRFASRVGSDERLPDTGGGGAGRWKRSRSNRRSRRRTRRRTKSGEGMRK